MIAAIAERYGPPDVIRVTEIPDPVPGHGQVRVRVRASSLNPLDSKLRTGTLCAILPLRFPAVLGFDLAGEVESLGPGSEVLSLGERVYGRIHRMTGGTHAQFATVDARVLDRIPGLLTWEQAAALPLAAMTALQALHEIARLREGRRLLVVGVGGVGAHAIQIGRALGAAVTAVASTDAAPLALRLGAAEVVDYTRGELEHLDRRFDAIFVTVFSRPYREYARLLERGGIYVTTGFTPGLLARAAVEPIIAGRRIAWVMSGASGERMRRLSALVAAGKVQPVTDAVFPLDRIQDAYAKLEAGHLRGKIVLTLP